MILVTRVLKGGNKEMVKPKKTKSKKVPEIVPKVNSLEDLEEGGLSLEDLDKEEEEQESEKETMEEPGDSEEEEEEEESEEFNLIKQSVEKIEQQHLDYANAIAVNQKFIKKLWAKQKESENNFNILLGKLEK